MAPAPTHRRGFLGTLFAGATLSALAGLVPRPLRAIAATPDGTPDGTPDDEWLKRVTGDHRQLFDMPQPGGARPLVHVHNYLGTLRDVYRVEPPKVTAVVTLYGTTVPLAFEDAMWAKYRLGEAIDAGDRATGAPAVRNVFARAPEGSPTLAAAGRIPAPAEAAITALQERGALFLLCNNALNVWSRRLADATKGDAKRIRADLLAHLLPDVHIVPAMVVAIDQAQKHGCSYMFLA